jgi:hypothetical protein
MNENVNVINTRRTCPEGWPHSGAMGTESTGESSGEINWAWPGPDGL